MIPDYNRPLIYENLKDWDIHKQSKTPQDADQKRKNTKNVTRNDLRFIK